MEKYVKDGHVAVIHSPGWGAGWSTWNDDWMQILLSMDKRIVERVMEVGYLTEEWLKENIPELEDVAHICVLGVDDPAQGGSKPVIEWVPEGAPFRIEEYDGYETVVLGFPDYRTA